jgi:ABC-type transporter Mla subunit MlaD
MANYVAGTIATAVAAPIGFVRALADLPGALREQMRQAEELMRSSQEQLAAVRQQVELLLAQMRELREVADALRATQVELERVSEQLAQILRAAEPADRRQRRGERFGGFFRRGQREAGETS